MNKSLAVIGATAILGAGAIVYLVNSPQVGGSALAVPSTTDAIQDAHQSFAALREEVAELKRVIESNGAAPGAKDPDVDLLKQDVAQLRQKLNELASTQLAQAGTSAPTSIERTPSQPVDTSPEERRAAADRRSKEALSKLEGALQAEDVDNSWLHDVQSKLQSVFQRDTLSGSTLATSDCRTSMCRIEITHEAGTDATEFQSEFVSETAELFPQGIFQQVTGPDGKQVTIGYFARDGHTLPKL